MPRRHVLPPNCPLRGLNREQAAEYLGVGVSKFDELVRDGRVAKPIRVGGRLIWDRLKLDLFFDALPDDGERNPWDIVEGAR